MTTATVNSKGQITIPEKVRAALGVDTGDRVEFVEVSPGRYEIIAVTRPVTDLKGMFGTARKAVSTEEMNAAIACLHAPATQTRLREVAEIVNRVLPWCGSVAQAFAWYHSQPLPAFGDQTAAELVREGRAAHVMSYLGGLALGGYA